MDYFKAIEVDDGFEEALEKVKAAFKAEGFGTLTEIDVRHTLKEKIDADVEPYRILGMCNPHLAKRALDLDRDVGVLLPCNVVVREVGERTVIEAQAPEVMVSVSERSDLKPIADEAAERIDRALVFLTR